MEPRFSHRDPLTERVARTVRETVLDPHAYSEGATEPQLVDVAKSFPHAERMSRALSRNRGCFGNCHQGRRPCTMPGVCGRPLAQHGYRLHNSTVPVQHAPAPAEACTELGMADHAAAHAERADERSRVQLIAGLVIAVLCVAVAFICNALLAAPV